MPITAFKLEIDCSKAYSRGSEADADEEGRGAGANYFVDLDLRELAREFMCFIRTARSVRISTRGHKFRKDTFAMLEYESEDEDSEDDNVISSGVSIEREEQEYRGGGIDSSQQEVERMMIVEDGEACEGSSYLQYLGDVHRPYHCT